MPVLARLAALALAPFVVDFDEWVAFRVRFDSGSRRERIEVVAEVQWYAETGGLPDVWRPTFEAMIAEALAPPSMPPIVVPGETDTLPVN